METRETSTQYHSNYENAVLLSGREPGLKDDHIKPLFSNDTKISVGASLKKPATKAISNLSASLNLPNCGNSFTQRSL